MAAIEVVPVENRDWIVRYEGDSAAISRHANRAQAETAARSHARQFGYDRIVIFGLDDERDVQIVEAERAADSPGDVKGPAAR